LRSSLCVGTARTAPARSDRGPHPKTRSGCYASAGRRGGRRTSGHTNNHPRHAAREVKISSRGGTDFVARVWIGQHALGTIETAPHAGDAAPVYAHQPRPGHGVWNTPQGAGGGWTLMVEATRHGDYIREYARSVPAMGIVARIIVTGRVISITRPQILGRIPQTPAWEFVRFQAPGRKKHATRGAAPGFERGASQGTGDVEASIRWTRGSWLGRPVNPRIAADIGPWRFERLRRAIPPDSGGCPLQLLESCYGFRIGEHKGG